MKLTNVIWVDLNAITVQISLYCYQATNKIGNTSKFIEWLRLLRQVDDDITHTRNHGTAREKEILDRHLRYAKFVTVVYWGVCTTTAILMSVTAPIRPYIQDDAIAQSAPLIFRSWFPFSISGPEYYAAYFIQLYIMALCCLIIPGWNSLMVTMMVYVIIELEQINWKLCEPQVPHFASENTYREPKIVFTVSTNKKQYATLVECAEKNIRVIKCVYRI